MRQNAPHRCPARALRSALHALVALVVVLLAGVAQDLSAAPPGPTVSAATPSQGEQGTLGLEVVIDGNGFEEGSNAVFLRSGTADPTGIAVLSTEYVTRKQVRARIDVAEDAPLELYDIEIQLANGRKGKGTELFGVVEKGGGGGSAVAPGAVTDFEITAIGSTSLDARWTETADDGYDVSSGRVFRYIIKARNDTFPTEENWLHEGTFTVSSPWAYAPGEIFELRMTNLAPDTTYYLGILAEDESGNLSPVTTFGPVTTLAFAETAWEKVEIDTCPQLWLSEADLDPSGRPGVLYWCDEGFRLALWTGAAWEAEIVPGSLPGNPAAFVFDPTTGEPTIFGDGTILRRTASGWVSETVDRKGGWGALAYWNGAPHVVYDKAGKRGSTSCVLAWNDGGGWDSEVVDSLTSCRNARLAFDPTGVPAATYRENFDDDNWLDGLKVAVRRATGWEITELFDGSGSIGSDPFSITDDPFQVYDAHVTFNAASSSFEVAFEVSANGVHPSGRVILFESSSVRLCESTTGPWSCQQPSVFDHDANAGLGYSLLGNFRSISRAPGAELSVAMDDGSGWTAELVDWGASDFTRILADPGGPPSVFYTQRGIGQEATRLFYAWRP